MLCFDPPSSSTATKAGLHFIPNPTPNATFSAHFSPRSLQMAMHAVSLVSDSCNDTVGAGGDDYGRRNRSPRLPEAITSSNGPDGGAARVPIGRRRRPHRPCLCSGVICPRPRLGPPLPRRRRPSPLRRPQPHLQRT